MSYEIVWSYDVGPDAREAFERAYGSTGGWAQLFSRGDGFIEVVLLEDATVPGRYLTIDRWRDAASFEAFMAQHGDAYAALDDALAPISSRGERVGVYVRRSLRDRPGHRAP